MSITSRGGPPPAFMHPDPYAYLRYEDLPDLVAQLNYLYSMRGEPLVDLSDPERMPLDLELERHIAAVDEEIERRRRGRQDIEGAMSDARWRYGLARRVKGAYDLADYVARDCGQSPRRHGRCTMFHSPFRGDRNPSFAVYEDGRWFDFGTGEGGDIIDYVRRRNPGETWDHCVIGLASMAGIPIPDPPPPARTSGRRLRVREVRRG